MRNISWCPCLNTRLNLHIGINCVERAVVCAAASIPVTTAKERLAQSEIAKKVRLAREIFLYKF